MSYVSQLIEALIDCSRSPVAGSSGNYVLTLDGDVAVTLCESQNGEHCFLASSPGWAAVDDAGAEASPAWEQDTPDADTPGVSERMCVDMTSGLITLMCVWPRAAVTSVELRRILHRHLELHRHWQGILET